MGEIVEVLTRTQVPGASPSLTAYVSRPEGSSRLPGVVLVHEAFGLDDNARAAADRVAAMGYVVVAPDLFSEGGALRCLKSTFAAMRRGEGRAFADIAAARELVLQRDDTTDAVGVIGFCMGGGFALMCAAPARGFAASSVNYGQLPPSYDVLAGGCPVLGSYGARDRGLRGAAATLDAELTRVGVPHEVTEYPDAGHAFLDEEMGGPWFLWPVMRLAGVGPEPTTAEVAWGRIAEFFGEHLRG
ncbi:MAG: dienelactone hydrolase family protein [Actinomycetota bacterium]|nr:dienelactone hydrolase family protein [Actinomycetota bacterium]